MKKLLWFFVFLFFSHCMCGQIRIVFRCDDYRMRNDSIQEQILDIFAKYNVPLNICIIPADTTSREVFTISDEYLKKWIKLKEQGILDIGLHGFMHANLNPKYGRWNEFENLSYDEQVNRLTRGKEIIESHLGGRINWFVPPRNVINEYTTKALNDCGFKILSANVTNRLNSGLEGIVLYPCTTEDFSEFDFFYNSENYKKYRSGTILLLFHGYTFTEGRYSFEQLDTLLNSLSTNKDFEICTFNKLLSLGIPGYDRGLQNKYYPLIKKIFGDDLFFLNRPSATNANVVWYLLFAILGMIITLPFLLRRKKLSTSILLEIVYLIIIGLILFTLPIGYFKSIIIIIAIGLSLDCIILVNKK